MLVRQSRRQLLKGSVLGSAAVLAAEVHAQPTNAPRETSQQHLSRMINGFHFSQMVHLAAKLRIADQLAGGPKTVAQLAAATKTHAESLYRVLRTLAVRFNGRGSELLSPPSRLPTIARSPCRLASPEAT